MEPVQTQAKSFDFEAFFHSEYERIARAMARVTGDYGRAEDLAAEAFWKLWRTPQAHGENAGGWLYRTAVRLGLNDLRSHRRRSRYEALPTVSQGRRLPRRPTPPKRNASRSARFWRCCGRERPNVMLRASGLSYEEVAAALELNPASVGTLVGRAQQAFRKEYVRQYGTR